DLIFFKDRESRYVRSNPAHLKSLGANRSDEVVGKTDVDFYPSDTARRFLEDEKRVMETGKPILNQIESSLAADGTPRYFSMSRLPWRDQNGNIMGTIGLAHDVTEQVLTERRLQSEVSDRMQAENFLDSILENLPTMLFVKEATELRFVRWNRAGEEIVGRSRNEFIGKNDYDFFPPDEANFFVAKDREALDARHAIDIAEEPLKTASGEIRWLHTKKFPMFDAQGRPSYLVGISEDITERKRTEENVTFQNALLSAQYDASPDAILVVGSDDRILSYNRRFVEMWGIPPEAIATGSAEAVRHAVQNNLADFDGWVKRTAEIYKEREARSHDEIAFRDGRILERYSSPVTAPDGGYLGRVWYFHDVTEARRAAEAIRQQNEYLNALQETSMGLMSRLDVNALLEDVVTRAGALVGTENGYVFLKEPKDDGMELRVGVGAYEGFVGRRAQKGVGLAGQVWETNAPVVVDDYRTWGGRLADPSRDILRAVAGVPLRSGNEVVGVIGLAYLDEAKKFGATEIQVLERFAQLAAIALDNARLYGTAQEELKERARAEQEIRRRNQELEAISRVSSVMTMDIDTKAALETLARELVQTFKARNCGIALLNPEGTALTVVADALSEEHEEHSVGIVIPVPGNPSSEFVIQNRKSLVIADAQNDPRTEPIHERMRQRRTKCLAIIPLLSGGDVIGTIGIDTTDPDHLFSDDEIRLAETMANQMANAIEKQRIFDQMRQQNTYLTALHDTTLGLMRRLDVEELLQNIITRAAQLVGTQHGYVHLVEPSGDELKMRVGIGVYEDFVGTRVKPGQGLAGTVWQNGEPIVVDDYRYWSGRLPMVDRDVLRAVVGVPLKRLPRAGEGAGEQTVGVLGLASLEEGQTFGAAQVEALNRFAELAAIALDNAQLYQATQSALEESKRVAQREKASAEITDKLYAAPDVKAVLRTAAEELRRSTGSRRAVVRLNLGRNGETPGNGKE
ncbi:MAG TPA: GAF domain-containing protein, partial [Anaerolineae bacterium]|nr:GAF domain-containing protein [Anaerolineae bacterium]